MVRTAILTERLDRINAVSIAGLPPSSCQAELPPPLLPAAAETLQVPLAAALKQHPH